jgi:hypothetical protein
MGDIMKKAVVADVEEIEAPDEERRSAWQKLVRELIRAVRRWIAAIFGGSFEELRGDVGTAKRVAAKAADAGGQALVGAGHALDAGLRLTHGAARVTGQILGGLVPRAAPGPLDVAAAVSAHDNEEARASADLRAGVRAQLAAAPAPVSLTMPEPAPRPALSPVETVAAVRDAIKRMQAGDLTAQASLAKLPAQVERWLCTLDEADAKRLIALPNGDLYRHVAGVANAPGLPPVAGASKDWRLSDADMARLVKRSMATMRSDEAEISAIAGRPGAGPRPPLPTEPLYGDDAEAAFRAAPRPGRAY